MSTLTEFLLARIDEDEEAARRVLAENGPRWRPDKATFHSDGWLVFDEDRTVVVREDDGGLTEGLCDHIARHDPARVLAECEAKRRWIDLAYRHAATVDGEWGCCHDAETLRRGYREAMGDWDEGEPIPSGCFGLQELAEFLAPLAVVYADHPDCRDEWKP